MVREYNCYCNKYIFGGNIMARILMDVSVVYEIIGYLGSALILVSFLFKDVRLIRLVNIVGALFFIVYGFTTKTWPTVVVNIALIIIHIFFLVKMRKKDI